MFVVKAENYQDIFYTYSFIIISIFRQLLSFLVFNVTKQQAIIRFDWQQMSGNKNKNSPSLQQNIFAHVEEAPIDSILGTVIAFNKDTNQKKINLGVGAYRDEQGKPYVFKIVQKVQKEIHSKPMNHEYLPIDGLPEFVKGARNLVFGQDSALVRENKIASVQSLSGTGSLRIGFDFLSLYSKRTVYISNPSWPVHKQMASKTGLKCAQYPYYSNQIKDLDFNKMITFLQAIENGSIILLHTSAHNPTGIDLSQTQWKELCILSKKKSFVPFFDMAYQGYASGDLKKDCWPVRLFAQGGFQMIVAQSFAKNLGLYGERIGALHIVTRSQQTAQRILSQLKIIIRTSYSNPNRYGAQIASKILNNKEYFQQWQSELKNVVAKRIIEVRSLLRGELQRIGAKGSWKHITDQIGMFSYTGLSEKTCEILTNKYAVYLLKTGRISLAGINHKNVGYLASSIKNALEQAQKQQCLFPIPKL